MILRKGRNLRRFLVKLAVAYLILVALWPLIRSSYGRGLGVLAAPVIRVLSVDEVTVTRGWRRGLLTFVVNVYSEADGAHNSIGLAIDPVVYGFGHITFTSLAIAIPGWVWRRRLAKWLAGTIALQMFFVFLMALNVFSAIAEMRHDYWSGDFITAIVPQGVYLRRVFLNIVGNQLVPALLWLVLLVYPLRNRRSAAFVAANRTNPAKKRRV